MQLLQPSLLPAAAEIARGEPEFLRALVEGTPAPARVSLQDSPAGGPGARALR